MSFVQYLDVLRSRWKYIFAGLLAGLGLAVLTTIFTASSFESTASLYVSARSDANSPALAYQGSLLSEQRVKSYSELLVSERTLLDTTRRLQLPEPIETIGSDLTVNSQPDTVLLGITARRGNPEEAARLANGVADSFISLVDQLERPVDAATPPSVVVRVVQPAYPDFQRVAPEPILNLVLGGALGLIVGLIAAAFRNAVDQSVRTPEQAEKLTATPNIGLVDSCDELADRKIVSAGRTREQFNQIRTNLQFLEIDSPSKTLVVTSSIAGEGKSTIVASLGASLADGGKKVLIVDGDLRRPTLADFFQRDNEVGLTNVLVGSVPFREAVQKVGDGLYLLASGPTPPNPSELFMSRRMADIIQGGRLGFDFVLIDAPPLLPVTDATVISQHADGLIMAIRYGKTPSGSVQEAAKRIESAGARAIGNIVTRVVRRSDSKSHYYDYHSRKAVPSIAPQGDGRPPPVGSEARAVGMREKTERPSPKPRAASESVNATTSSSRHGAL